MPTAIWMMVFGSSICALLVAAFLFYWNKIQDYGAGERIDEIRIDIRKASFAFLRRMYLTLRWVVVVVGVALWISSGFVAMLAFVTGAVLSALSGAVGVSIASIANASSAIAAKSAKDPLEKAFLIQIRAGGVMGLPVVGTALLGIGVLYWLTGDIEITTFFSLGASIIAMFAKVGGGIFTKTADMSADFVGKVELGIPEDDPRNPAVIADNAGDLLGDVAGMGADIFDSYAAMLVSVCILSAMVGIVWIPLGFASVGVVASIVGVLLARIWKGRLAKICGTPSAALNIANYTTFGIFMVLTYGFSRWFGVDQRIWLATMSGLAAATVIGLTSDYFTNSDKFPVIDVAKAAVSGAGVLVVKGTSYALYSPAPPLFIIGASGFVAYKLCESLGSLYPVVGIGHAALGMLAGVGMIVANDAFGPVADNSRGLAEMAGFGEIVVAITDKLDAAGNTVKAITKGFSIGASGLTVITLWAAYAARVYLFTKTALVLDLMDPAVLWGVLIGLAMPAIFSGQVMLAVTMNVEKMTEEIRRQFREIPGLREMAPGVKPDYERCVDIAAKGALKKLLPAGIVAVVATLIVGFGLGVRGLGGFLGGAIFSGLLLAPFLANAGGLWDNAKKLIETGKHGGRGSDAHKAAVIGDTIGDPFKDTAGPSLNTVITVMSLVAIVIVPLVVKYSIVK